MQLPGLRHVIVTKHQNHVHISTLKSDEVEGGTVGDFQAFAFQIKQVSVEIIS